MKEEYIKNGGEAKNINKNAKPERNKKTIIKIMKATRISEEKIKLILYQKEFLFLPKSRINIKSSSCFACYRKKTITSNLETTYKPCIVLSRYFLFVFIYFSLAFPLKNNVTCLFVCLFVIRYVFSPTFCFVFICFKQIFLMSNSNIVYLFIHIYSYLNFLSDSILLCRLHKNSDSSMKSVIVTWLFCGRCLATLVKIIPMEIFLDFLFRFFFFFSICFLQFKIYIVSLRTFCDAMHNYTAKYEAIL